VTSNSGCDLQETLLERLADRLEPEHRHACSDEAVVDVGGAIVARQRHAHTIGPLRHRSDRTVPGEHVQRNVRIVDADV
jgi:hypothetical protein